MQKNRLNFKRRARLLVRTFECESNECNLHNKFKRNLNKKNFNKQQQIDSINSIKCAVTTFFQHPICALNFLVQYIIFIFHGFYFFSLLISVDLFDRQQLAINIFSLTLSGWYMLEQCAHIAKWQWVLAKLFMNSFFLLQIMAIYKYHTHVDLIYLKNTFILFIVIVSKINCSFTCCSAVIMCILLLPFIACLWP